MKGDCQLLSIDRRRFEESGELTASALGGREDIVKCVKVFGFVRWVMLKSVWFVSNRREERIDTRSLNVSIACSSIYIPLTLEVVVGVTGGKGAIVRSPA